MAGRGSVDFSGRAGASVLEVNCAQDLGGGHKVTKFANAQSRRAQDMIRGIVKTSCLLGQEL